MKRFISECSWHRYVWKGREESRSGQRYKLWHNINRKTQPTLQWVLKIGQCFRVIWSWDERSGSLQSQIEKSFEGLVTSDEATLISWGSAPRSFAAVGFISGQHLSIWGDAGCYITSSTKLEMMIVSQSAAVNIEFNQPISGHMAWAR